MSITKKTRVLVVDDSAVIRAIIADSISQQPDMEVAGIAHDGQQAVQMAERLRPDVVTLDVQMPNMDGMTALDALLAKHPVPVLMVSSLTKANAAITLDALDRGAIDYVTKPDYGAATREMLQEELPRKIRLVAGIDVRRILEIRRDRKHRQQTTVPREPPPKAVTRDVPVELARKCIALGISTGGPPALTCLFEGLQPPMPPIVIVQHMPPGFTKPLAWRLDSMSKLSIKEAATGDVLAPNHVLIAPGGSHLELRRDGDQVKAVIRDGSPVSGHKPSVDVMMTCAAEIYKENCLGVVMTGMGRDGVAGCAAIRARGGYVLGQDAATSDVYGMNKAAFVEGHVDKQFGLPEAAAIITRRIQALAGRRTGQDVPAPPIATDKAVLTASKGAIR